MFGGAQRCRGNGERVGGFWWIGLPVSASGGIDVSHQAECVVQAANFAEGHHGNARDRLRVEPILDGNGRVNLTTRDFART